MRAICTSPRLHHRHLLLGILGALLVWSGTSDVQAELAPGRNDPYVARTVVGLLRARHLDRPRLPGEQRLDDEISQRAFKTFLRQLDPMKIYFYQSDIDEFAKDRTLLDDQVRRGDLHFAYDVFNRFLERLDERVALVPGLLAMEHDFDADEELVSDPDVAVYAKTPEESKDRWRKRIKFDLLSLKEEEVEGDEAVDRLTRRYSSYAKRMQQYKSDDLLELYLSAITTSFDPHTTYMSPTSLENFAIQMRLNLEGIGAALMLEDGYTVVSKIIPGGAADKQGELKPEDRITSVGQGTAGEMVDVVDMRLNDVVQLIRGKKGSIVRLGVRANDGNSKTIQIVRDRVELKDSEARQEVIESPSFQGRVKPNGAPYRIGVIKLPSFYMDMKAARAGIPNFKSTTRDVKRILDEFRREGVDGVVLDLRFNGGGSLTEAIQLTGLFIDLGPVVQVKDPSNEAPQVYNDSDRGTAWDGPLVVVTNKFSASASEILAGAIQDYKRGIVVGDTTTHGKGTVQSLLDLSEELFGADLQGNLPKLGALKITMQKFYRPNGDSTQKRGVVVDVPFPSTTNEMDIGEADMDYAVEFDTVTPSSHTMFNLVSPDIVDKLNAAFQQRIASSEDFAKDRKRIELYRKQKERTTVSLNEEEFFARRKELSADKEEEDNIKKIDDTNEIVIDLEDHYNREILRVTLDYMRLLSGIDPTTTAQR